MGLRRKHVKMLAIAASRTKLCSQTIKFRGERCILRVLYNHISPGGAQNVCALLDVEPAVSDQHVEMLQGPGF